MLPVVCLPGLLSTGSAFERVQGLAGAHILSLPALADFGAIAADIAAQLPPRCLLVGHSLGSYLYLELWRRAPGQIAGLALLSCTASADTPATSEARRKAVRYAQKAGIDALAAAVAKQTLGPDASNDPEVNAQILKMARAVGIEIFAHHQTALANRPDSTATLPGITCPVLAVTGSADSVTPPEAGRALAGTVPRGRFHMIPGAGHLLPLEAPGALDSLLQPFLLECQREVSS
jgi:pimeloyl-ACP methyl ester carboxylesterase